jgi:hypothetical protein
MSVAGRLLRWLHDILSNALIKARDITTDIDSSDFWSPLLPFFTI